MITVGGTGTGGIEALRESIKNFDQLPDVFLTCPKGEMGYYDATCVGGARSLDPEEAVRDVPLKKKLVFTKGDPTPDSIKEWDETTLATIYALCDELKEHLEQGHHLLITCVGGNNRSRMFAHAIDPSQPAPECEVLRRIAENYHKGANRANLVPLQMKRALRSRA
jgi:hypothetical protein